MRWESSPQSLRTLLVFHDEVQITQADIDNNIKCISLTEYIL